jgi:hypothetical protein
MRTFMIAAGFLALVSTTPGVAGIDPYPSTVRVTVPGGTYRVSCSVIGYALRDGG